MPLKTLLRATTAAAVLGVAMPAGAQVLNLPPTEQVKAAPVLGTTLMNWVGANRLTAVTQATANEILLQSDGKILINMPEVRQRAEGSAPSTATFITEGGIDVRDATVQTRAVGNMVASVPNEGDTFPARYGVIGIQQKNHAVQSAYNELTDVKTGGGGHTDASDFIAIAQGNQVALQGPRIGVQFGPRNDDVIRQTNNGQQIATQIVTGGFHETATNFTTAALGNSVSAEAKRVADFDRIEQDTTSRQTATFHGTEFDRLNSVGQGTSTIQTAATANTIVLSTDPERSPGNTYLGRSEQIVSGHGQTATTYLDVKLPNAEPTRGNLEVGTSASGNVLSMTGNKVYGFKDLNQTAYAGQIAKLEVYNAHGTKNAVFDTRATGNQMSFSANSMVSIGGLNQAVTAPQNATSMVNWSSFGGNLTVQTIGTGNSIRVNGLTP